MKDFVLKIIFVDERVFKRSRDLLVCIDEDPFTQLPKWIFAPCRISPFSLLLFLQR